MYLLKFLVFGVEIRFEVLNMRFQAGSLFALLPVSGTVASISTQ